MTPQPRKLGRLVLSLALLSAAAPAPAARAQQKTPPDAVTGFVTRLTADGNWGGNVTDGDVDVYRADAPGECHARTSQYGGFRCGGLAVGGVYVVVASAPGAAPAFAKGVKAGTSVDLKLKAGDGSRPTYDEAFALAGVSPPGRDGGREREKVAPALGSIIGAVAGGGKGAAIGAEIGGGASRAPRPEDEAGEYVLAEKYLTFNVVFSGGRLVLKIPGQPAHTLTHQPGRVSGADSRDYEFQDAAGVRHRVSFRPADDDARVNELVLRSPQGTYTLRRSARSAAAATPPAGPPPSSSPARDTAPPEIEITSPRLERGLKLGGTQASRVSVRGRATDASGVNEVLVQGSPARLDEEGNFSAEVLLRVGENRVAVEAVDINGNRGSADFTLRRETPAAAAAPHVNAPGVSAAAGAAGTADAVTPPAAGSYHALVIGINEYKGLPRLKTAEADARAVAEVLRDQLGFEVNLLLNATRQQIVGALNRYRQTLGADANLVIYYAGHGYFDRAVEKAYWLPVNASMQDNSDWISADDVTVNVKGIAARHVLIISDSCYSGTISRGVNPERAQPAARGRYLRRMLEGRSRTLIASGGDEPVADGGEGGHSVFASALLRGLRQAERDAFTAEELFYGHIRESVAGRSEQTPEYNPLRNSGHEGGDFVFFRKK